MKSPYYVCNPIITNNGAGKQPDIMRMSMQKNGCISIKAAVKAALSSGMKVNFVKY
jgi:hypothetical protein